ncbi:TPA: hypothetical protein KD862_003670 [Vibrio cholerae]|jgi:hypothetical protein|uniref:hypothetical protein n=1 Tax=Vibrio cholerae TaxID=666 RepID=UPI0011D80DA2|nr:hypothetical protein [Vibrio cholerae]EIY4763822.1 hypothetical protein [Vibrio cholerae]EKF9423211.1 hypothetical protein [Vibrio cholerae]TXZ21403.1 hypothetical protein FXE70_09900 [Vibrio cholerae]GIA14649.1 hypothetical protein VCSRO84_1738 [Vibrio cholerae]HBC3849707.1 hypothetical protein [Vibrio cholerae]
MNTSIVNHYTDNNLSNPLATLIHENKSCEIAISNLHKLASDLRDLNIFLESDVSLPVTTLQQLREQRMTIIEKLEFCLSSLPNAIQVLSLETN